MTALIPGSAVTPSAAEVRRWIRARRVRAARARFPRVVLSASWIRLLSKASTASTRDPLTTVPEASAVWRMGERWWPWMTSPSATSTARSMVFSSSRTLPGQW